MMLSNNEKHQLVMHYQNGESVSHRFEIGIARTILFLEGSVGRVRSTNMDNI